MKGKLRMRGNKYKLNWERINKTKKWREIQEIKKELKGAQTEKDGKKFKRMRKA